jgi:hypothetical protein
MRPHRHVPIKMLAPGLVICEEKTSIPWNLDHLMNRGSPLSRPLPDPGALHEKPPGKAPWFITIAPSGRRQSLI